MFQPRYHLAFGLLSLLLGIVLVFGGAERVSGTSYVYIAEKGGPVVWGISFVVLGTAMLLSHNQFGLQKWLLIAGAVGYTAFCLAFLVAARIYPDANLTAVVVYAWIAVMHSCAARRVVVLQRRQEFPKGRG